MQTYVCMYGTVNSQPSLSLNIWTMNLFIYGVINRQPPFNTLVWGLLKLTSIKFCTDSWYPTVMLKSQYQLCVKKEGTTK